MHKLKIAQIGVEHDHAADIMWTMRHSEQFEVIGYSRVDDCDIQFSEKKHFYDGVTELTLDELFDIPGLEAVTVESTEKNLVRYAIMALERGLHVHIDKPGGESLEEFENLITLAEEKGLAIHFGYMYRYNSAVRMAKELIKSGELGEICSIEAHMNTGYPDKKRKWLSGLKGGMMFFLGCHMIDLVLQMQGIPKNVHALNNSSGKNGINSKDLGFAAFEYENGISFVKSIAIDRNAFLRRQLVITGTKDTLIINPIEKCVDIDNFMFSSAYSLMSTGKTVEMPPNSRYGDMFVDFYDIVVNGKQPEFTYSYELDLFKTILEASGLK